MIDPDPHVRVGDLLVTRLHSPVPSTVVVRPAGDVDLLTAQTFRRDLEQQLRTRVHVIVDLQEIGVLGSSGLEVLVGVHEAARAAGVHLYLTGTEGPGVARALREGDLLDVLPVSDLDTDALLQRLMHPRRSVR